MKPINLFDLTGKVAVVTGGTGVLGTGLCHDLARAGAAVAVLATTTERTQHLAQQIVDAGGRAIGLAVDVLDKTSVEEAAKAVLAHFGKVDILINGAGGNKPAATVIPGQTSFFDLPPDALQWVFNLNLLGTLFPAQMFGKSMAQRRDGVILNISSVSAFHPLTRVVAYGAAKAAINNFTQWLAVHMAQEYSPNIRVNALAPGFFLTEQNRFLLTEEHTGALTPRGEKIINHTPQGRFGIPEDLTGTVLWLVSDASRFVTGVVVPVDGGFTAYSGV